jgi:tetratricopeptide (TPR) repeat protein
MNYVSTIKRHVALIIICAGFAAVGYLRINDSSLYTDSTRYVIWGTSFSHARGFVDATQPDAERYVVNAPLYSAVLSPVLLFFPYSLVAAKLWTLLIGVGALIVFYIWLGRRYGNSAAVVGTLILAANPLMLVMATEAMSEMSFIVLAILAVMLFETIDTGKPSLSGNHLVLLLVLGLLPLLREVSVGLVGAYVVVLLFKKQYKSAVAPIVGVAVFLGAWMVRNVVIVGVPPTSQSTNVNFILGHFVTPADSSLVSELYQRMLVNMKSFYVFSVSLLMYPFPQPLIVDPHPLFRFFFRALSTAKYILPFVFLPLVITGIVHDLKRGYKAYVPFLFIIFYSAIILLYPVQDARFLLPLLPFLIYYAVAGFHLLAKVRVVKNISLRIGIVAVVIGLIVVPNVDCEYELIRTNWEYQHTPDDLYATIQKASVSKELFIRPWKPFGKWISENIPDSTVIASTFKELSIFIGNRKILEVNYGVPLPMFERFLRDYGVEYVLSAGERENIRPYEFIMRESKRYWFEPVHSLLGLTLYKVHSSFIETAPPFHTTETAGDTTSPHGLLNLGRLQIVRGEYQSALNNLSAAGNRGAYPALVAYQMTVAHAMSLDQYEAERSLRQLYSLPQSTSYIPAARMHIQAMDTYIRAMKSTNVLQRSAQLFDVAALYWNFGYYQQGYSLLRDILRKDTAFFVGLLWGWDYATQLGDSRQAALHLRMLESIDRSNPVVSGYRAITAVEDTLRRTRDRTQRGRLRLEEASQFWAVGLYDDAFDFAYRSIGEDPGNKPAFLFLIDTFRKTDKPWGLRRAELAMSGKR